MERSTTVTCIVLFVFSFVVGLVLTETSNGENGVLADGNVRDGDKLKGFWIGPRLGRRKRNPRQEDLFCTYVLEKEPMVGKQQKASWIILAVKKCKKSDFTPRLGRGSGEEIWNNAIPHYDRWISDAEYGDIMSQRSPPFVPRLGRHILYSPRLGRVTVE